MEGGGASLRNSGDCVTLMKAAATAESSVSAVKLYPEEYSCNMYRKSFEYIYFNTLIF